MITIHLDHTLPEETRNAVKRHSAERFGADVTVDPGDVSLGLDLATLSSLGAFVVALIALILQMQREIADTSRDMQWTVGRLKEVIHAEMLAQGAHRVEILQVDNFRALVEGATEPCKVTVRERQDVAEYCIYIFYDGDVYSMRKSGNG